MRGTTHSAGYSLMHVTQNFLLIRFQIYREISSCLRKHKLRSLTFLSTVELNLGVQNFWLIKVPHHKVSLQLDEQYEAPVIGPCNKFATYKTWYSLMSIPVSKTPYMLLYSCTIQMGQLTDDFENDPSSMSYDRTFRSRLHRSTSVYSRISILCTRK